ncbi:crossover junction endodeoxyribonuclease RuvC [candidate division LCP-89 bacterium B3_LCP]|uniref:Crossover junction endodeoxyribonuclease RuvC n=1 Tax=candidate division LCP-89 bacterium B3_LCP TaxID=2012998 RepID=A0A532V5Q1_UNCL8|nr:MAG: crossover junction endodeoxyribonuclease RuvC [candidate division LCP-89 bacterium B3_LCP]
MRIIGVDPGLVSCGVGIVDSLSNNKGHRDDIKFIHTEVIKPPKGDLSKRLLFLHDHLVDIIKRQNAIVMAIEDQFYGKNVQTAFKTGQARGAALLAAARCGLDTTLFPPARVKLAIVGNGRASKEQVRHMVGQILNLKQLPSSLDCSDALAVAICRAFTPNLVNSA